MYRIKQVSFINLLQLRSIAPDRGCRALSSSVLKRHHLHQLDDSVLLHPMLKTTTSNFICTRKFSYMDFYSFLSESRPVTTFQNVLVNLHEASGLPWWALIMLTTFSIRTLVVLPMAIHQNQVIGRLLHVMKEIGELAPRLNIEVNLLRKKFDWDEQHCKKVFRISLRSWRTKFIVRDNCHPFKIVLLGLFQMPVWVCFSMALRNLTFISKNMHPAPVPVESLKTEGLLWFSVMTYPDPILIPLLLVTVNLALTEVHALRQVGEGSLLSKILLNTSRVFIVIIGAVATVNPSSVSFYWLCSSTFGLIQSVLLISPKFRKAVNIPPTGTESSTPFQDIATKFHKKLQKYSKNS